MCFFIFFFFFNDTATTEIYTLPLHDALPISVIRSDSSSRILLHTGRRSGAAGGSFSPATCSSRDRKSTRLNSSHGYISYAVFCLKKKKKQKVRLYSTSIRVLTRGMDVCSITR